MSGIWFVPLGAGAIGAFGLTWLAARLRREVEVLQKSMRPLRTDHRTRRHVR